MAQVLVVDDAADARYGLARLLALRGHEPVCAVDGLQALEVLRRQRPALVILDVSMPGMDGMMVLEWMRRTRELVGVPVLVYSAAGDEGDRWRAESRGAEYVEKGSVDWHELAAHIDRLLSQEQAPAESLSAKSPPAEHRAAR